MIKDKKTLARMADEDLRTPSHDAIMLWLHENVEQICRSLLAEGLDSHRSKFESAIKKLAGDDLAVVMADYGKEEFAYVVRISSKWEAPIRSGNVMVGFVDLLAEVSGSCSPWVYKPSGYGNPKPEARWSDGYNKIIAFEVKTSIRSIGETIRQINTYRAYMRSATQFCIVSPDDRFRAILESQDILFVKAPAVGDGVAQGGLF